jgi:hypothetical protein
MDKIKLAFQQSLSHYQRIRLRMHTKEYEKSFREPEDLKRFDDVNEKLIELLGPESKTMLIEYTDLILAMYNKDSAYFYSAGIQDCEALYDFCRAILKGTQSIPQLEEKTQADIEEELDELINT